MAVVLYEAIFVNSFPVASMGGAILPRTITVLLALHTLTRTLEIRLTELLEKSRAKVILRFRKKKKKKALCRWGGSEILEWSCMPRIWEWIKQWTCWKEQIGQKISRSSPRKPSRFIAPIVNLICVSWSNNRLIKAHGLSRI